LRCLNQLHLPVTYLAPWWTVYLWTDDHYCSVLL